jgi:hypothetical protein
MRAIEGESEHQNLTAVAYVRDPIPVTRFPFQEKQTFQSKKEHITSQKSTSTWESTLQIKLQNVAQPQKNLLVLV